MVSKPLRLTAYVTIIVRLNFKTSTRRFDSVQICSFKFGR